MIKIEEVKFDSQGLVPAIVQDARNCEILTLAYMNRESLAKTLESGETWFWSRSRQALWHKGETSGNTQQVVDVLLDCDHDAIVVRVTPSGPACHTGARSCFDGAESNVELGVVLDQLYELIAGRERERPEKSYTTYLFNEGLDKILKKVGEESAETIIAAKNTDDALLVGEVTDLIYHLVVLLVARDVSLDDIAAELRRREQHTKK